MQLKAILPRVLNQTALKRYFSFEPERNPSKMFAAILKLNLNETKKKHGDHFWKTIQHFFLRPKNNIWSDLKK